MTVTNLHNDAGTPTVTIAAGFAVPVARALWEDFGQLEPWRAGRLVVVGLGILALGPRGQA